MDMYLSVTDQEKKIDKKETSTHKDHICNAETASSYATVAQINR